MRRRGRNTPRSPSSPSERSTRTGEWEREGSSRSSPSRNAAPPSPPSSRGPPRSRLRTKFWWANSEEHRNERKSNCYSLRGKKAKDAALLFSYIDQYAKDNNIGVSLIDKRVLSATYTTNGYVVTDDVDMQSVAAAFGIKVFSTLQLLQLLYERGKVKVEEIDSVIEYWNYENDLPTGFAAIHAWRNGLER